MVHSTSQKGTSATATLKSSAPRKFRQAVINSPPAEAPEMASFSDVVSPHAIRCSAEEQKSRKVFIFVRNLPSFSYQARPISPPPRMCAMT